MSITLTPANGAALFVAMLILALLPSVSVFTVVARAISHGFTHATLTTLGIVLADILFILVAIYGLTVLTQILGAYFFLLKYFAGAYLIWLGMTLLRSKPNHFGTKTHNNTNAGSSLLIGLLITLADQKAILFYLGFLPAFLDLSTITWLDSLMVILIATLALAIAKLSYAVLAIRTDILFNNSAIGKWINICAGLVMLAAAAVLLVKA